MYTQILNAKTAHDMLDELETKGFIISDFVPAPSAQARWNRKNSFRDGKLKQRKVVKRSYELTEKGRQLLIWWDAFIQAYEGEGITVPQNV